MRILGVDPGLNITGYGLIEGSGLKVSLIEAGFIRTDPKQRLQERLEHIHIALNKLIRALRPEVMVLEKLYAHWKHSMTASILGHARGVICLAAKKNNIPLVEYSATRIKKAILGNGHASKLQVQRIIQGLFSLESLPKPVDIADALAVSIAHSYMSTSKLALSPEDSSLAEACD